MYQLLHLTLCEICLRRRLLQRKYLCGIKILSTSQKFIRKKIVYSNFVFVQRILSV